MWITEPPMMHNGALGSCLGNCNVGICLRVSDFGNLFYEFVMMRLGYYAYGYNMILISYKTKKKVSTRNKKAKRN